MKSSIHVVAVLVALVAGCGASRQRAWDAPTAAAREVTDVERENAPNAARAAAAAWSERGSEESLRAAIAGWEQVVAVDPNDHETLVRLAHAYYFLADGYLSFDPSNRVEMLATFEKGTHAAELALMALSSDFATRMRAGTRFDEAVAILDGAAAPALYWRSANLAKWVAAQGSGAQRMYKDEIRAGMARSLELDASYDYGGAHRYFGTFYARTASYAGGDLGRSKLHFEQALRVGPRYFATRVLYAEEYAAKARDRATFDAQLAYVLAHEPSELADAAPENTVEQQRAVELQGRAGRLFH